MITNREIARLANEWQLRQDVVEKDYALGWLLAGVAHNEQTRAWGFKGGTCLRKCWFETYRFSEDLDFTVAPDDLDPSALQPTFSSIAEWIYEQCGLELRLDDKSFRLRQNKRGQPTIQGKIGYLGPLGAPTAPKVKLDLTADEVVVQPLELRPVFHPFSDVGDTAHSTDHVADVRSYSLPELLGEKLRALTERCRPRDLYDVVHTYRHPDLIGRHREVADVLERKCAHAGVERPTLASMLATPFRAEIETEWSSMLGHQLPFLPPFTGFWGELENVFDWLDGVVALPQLPSIPSREEVSDWLPARYMTTWQTGSPMELIRFAGANRLKVSIDYRPERGRAGPRVVEPYSLRCTSAGRLLLMVVNDHAEVRSYRVDRIRGVSIEPETFVPRYAVEF